MSALGKRRDKTTPSTSSAHLIGWILASEQPHEDHGVSDEQCWHHKSWYVPIRLQMRHGLIGPE